MLLLSRILLTISLILVLSLDKVRTSAVALLEDDNNNVDNIDTSEKENQQEQQEEEQPCYDNNPKCPEWSLKGECEKNTKYMLNNCRFSCDNCFKQREINPLLIHYKDYDGGFVADGDNGDDLGVEQQLIGFDDDDGTNQNDIAYIISKSRNYMILLKEKYDKNQIDLTPLKKCKNKNPKCSYYALVGKCSTDYDYMFNECGPACSFCPSPSNNNNNKQQN